MLLLSVTLIFSSCNSSNSNDNPDNEPYEYHNENIDVLASVLDSSVASSVVSALEESCAIEEKTKLVAQDLIKVGDNCYELYAGLMLRFYIDNGQISLYTFETAYSEDSKILLYDSSSQGIIKVLTADERNNLIYTQRRATVHSTVAISPCKGVLLHNALGSTKIDLTFNNKSDSKITYLNIVITPFMGGASFGYNSKAYVLDCDLPVSGSVDKSITTTGWTNYDSYKITQVTVMFSDGSTIGFDSFDCQFLNGYNDEIIDSDNNSNNSNSNIENPENTPSVCTVRFVQGDGFSDIEFQVEKNGKIGNIPSPQQVEGFDIEWEEFDHLNITGNITVNAVKTPIVYNIAFHNGNQITKSTFTILDLPLKLQDAEHPTDLFSGWYNNANYSGEVVENINSIGNFDLYAAFVEGTKGLQFNKTTNGYAVSKYVGQETNVVIPSEYKGKLVTEIGSGAFALAKIVEISLPSSIQKIDYGAFDNCKNITSITIPDSVCVIEGEAFRGCTSLTTLYLGNSIQKIGYCAFLACNALDSVFISDLSNWVSIEFDYRSNPISYASKFYVNDELLTVLTVPEGVETIKALSFCGYDGLTKIILSNSVKKIEASAFASCENLKEVAFNNNLKEIGDGAFSSCYNLTNICLGDSVEIIGERAFSIDQGFYVGSLQRQIVLSKSIKAVGYNCFYAFSGIPCTIEFLGTIKEWCNISFEDSQWLPSDATIYINGEIPYDVQIPDGITSINPYAFCGWTWLKTISIPNSVSQIGERAFNGCTSLESVIFETESQLNSIGTESFASCFSLTNILLPEGLQTIGAYAFSMCDKLPKLIIPSSVISIGNDAFNYCTNLTIYCETQNSLVGWDSCWNEFYPFHMHDKISVYWYSTQKPTGEGTFWHYSADGEILIWEE